MSPWPDAPTIKKIWRGAFPAELGVTSRMATARHMRWTNLFARATMCGVFSATAIAGAHPELDQQIILLTDQIQRDPDNATLWAQRADLYRQHQVWDDALADLHRADLLRPNDTNVRYGMAQTYLDAQMPKAALAVIDGLLKIDPGRGYVHLLRGHALVRLERQLDAADAYAQAIELIPEPRPEHYLDRSIALERAGEAHIDAAITSLDEAIPRIGRLVALQKRAIDLEVERGNIDDAVARIDALLEDVRRPEVWLFRKGELFEQHGRPEDAITNYEAATNAISALPERYQQHQAVIALRQSCVDAIARIRLQGDSTGPDSTSVDVGAAPIFPESER